MNNTLTTLRVYGNGIGAAGKATLRASAHPGCTVHV
jgi:hypothetical protein